MDDIELNFTNRKANRSESNIRSVLRNFLINQFIFLLDSIMEIVLQWSCD